VSVGEGGEGGYEYLVLLQVGGSMAAIDFRGLNPLHCGSVSSSVRSVTVVDHWLTVLVLVEVTNPYSVAPPVVRIRLLSRPSSRMNRPSLTLGGIRAWSHQRI
jgi:hypothetical protein